MRATDDSARGVESAKGPDSPFEGSVAKALDARGHDVALQVGVAGYFIDLAVRDPETPSRFVLGIECDGATYHRARSARDRDRLRQEALERLGWRLARVWSTDWFRDPKGRRHDWRARSRRLLPRLATMPRPGPGSCSGRQSRGARPIRRYRYRQPRATTRQCPQLLPGVRRLIYAQRSGAFATR